ncbi:MAG: hypothetical protein WCL56_11400 [Sediminibacterium sp.]
MKIILSICIFVLFTINIFAQVGIGTNSPNASAKLEINANNKGLLIPRVALTGSTDATTITSPSNSLLVYNTATTSDVLAGYYYNSGTSGSPVWVRLNTGTGITVGVIGSSNPNGASVAGGVLSLSPADATNGGIVTNGSQTFAGAKTLTSPTLITPVLGVAKASSIAIGASAVDASAVLDVTSTTQGFLPPRMTGAQRDAINNAAQGLMIYCNNCGANGEAEYYNGLAWVNLI